MLQGQEELSWILILHGCLQVGIVSPPDPRPSVKMGGCFRCKRLALLNENEWLL